MKQILVGMVAAIAGGLLVSMAIVGVWPRLDSAPEPSSDFSHDQITYAGNPPAYWRRLINELDPTTSIDALPGMPPDPAAIPVLCQLLKDPDPEIRRYAAHCLFALGIQAEPALPQLCGALRDTDPFVRREILRCLGKMGQRARAAEDLIAILLDDNELLVRIEAALAKWQVGGNAESCVKVVAAALRTNQGRSCKDRCIDILAIMGPDCPAAIPPLVEAMQDPDCIESAVKALGRLGPPGKDAIPLLEESIKSGHDRRVRLAAAESLWKVTHEADLPLATLTEIASDTAEDTLNMRKCEAVRIMGDMGAAAKEAAPICEQMLKTDDFNLRVTAAMALWKITGKIDKSLVVLVQTLPRADTSCQCEILKVLGEMGPSARKALPMVKALCNDTDDRVRRHAREAVKKINR
jgi:HEAT repeat protein